MLHESRPSGPWLIFDVRQKTMIDIQCLAGRRIAVILVDYSEKQSGDWYVVSGVAKVKDRRLFVDRGTDTDFPIPDDTHDRIKEVTPAIASVVGDAEFVITLSVGPKPDGDGRYLPTGVRLPVDEKTA
jgi:hypothetical protein